MCYKSPCANPSHFRQGSAHPRANPLCFWHGSARLDLEVLVCQCVTNYPVLSPLNPALERESPAVKAGLIRVYGQWDNYRTNSDDFREVYLFGIQVDG